MNLRPTPKQAAFLMLMTREAFYGGAAGPGKSVALFLAAIQYCDVPGYAALLMRRTFPDLNQPGGLIYKSQEWLTGTGAVWNEQKHRWTFPSGAVLQFGHAASDKDIYNYRGSEYHFIGLDELTQFTEAMYRFLFSRLRRQAGSTIPIRMRAASNPGDIGHDWVKAYFIDGKGPLRPFIPGLIEDNPYLDAEEYFLALDYLDPITRQQLRRGDWSARHGGSKWKREWFKDRVVDVLPSDWTRMVRFWDLAATKEKPGRDPDWTVGELWAAAPGPRWYRVEGVRMRGTPKEVEDTIQATAQLDLRRWGRGMETWMEQEGGAAGPTVAQHYATLFAGLTFHAEPKRIKTDILVGPLSTQCEAGNVYLVNHQSLPAWLDELEAYPLGAHDDQVVASTGAFLKLAMAPKAYAAGAGTTAAAPGGGHRPSGAGTRNWIQTNYDR
jgi:predicted phage terminase large subunit-like protein